MSVGAASDVTIAPLTADVAGAWGALFDDACSGCFCRYWHFDGDKNAWLARLAGEVASSHAGSVGWGEQVALLGREDETARGLVALAPAASGEASSCVGWLKLAPRAAVPKLRRLPVYRALDLGDDDGVYAVGCLLVAPSWRRRGVARALVAAADGFVAAWGGRAIEAYPHVIAPDVTQPEIADERLWRGPREIFDACGYRVVGGEAAYPVLRKVLR